MSNIKWALVLSGGGARGLAHIGILRGLEDAGYPQPSLIVGTSMGAIVGGFYACGMDTSEMVRFITKDFNIGDYLDSFVYKLDGPVGQIMQAGHILANLTTRPGADRGQRVLDLFTRLTEGKKFDETSVPFRCNAMDLISGRQIIFNSGSVAAAMRASMSFPVFFDPVTMDGMCLVDGGLLDNMPVAIARDEGFHNIIAVDVNRFIPAKAGDLRSGPQIIYRCMEGVLYHQGRTRRVNASVTLNVFGDETPFSFNMKKELIALGSKTIRDNMKTLDNFFKPRFGFFGRRK